MASLRSAAAALSCAVALAACKKTAEAPDDEADPVETATGTARKSVPPVSWRAPRTTTRSESLLELVDGTAVLRLEVTGFDQLETKERVYAYWLAQAALAGDDIVWEQRGPHNLAVKELVEQVLLAVKDGSAEELEALRTYAKRVWINKGVYDAISYRKFVPVFAPAQLESLLARAIDRGVKLQRFGVTDRASLRQKWPLIQRVVFDPSYQRASSDKNPPEGEDILSASSNTYYQGVRLEDLQDFKPKYPLNSRVIKRGSRVIEQPYRTGGDGVAPGLYAESLGKVRNALRMAIEAASGDAAKAQLRLLDEFLRTGELEHLQAYQRSWVVTDPPVDLVLGFIEVYGDPRGEKGEYEGLVLMRDESATKLLRLLAENAAYFEQRMPWDERFKKPADENATPPVAFAAQVLTASGRTGPILPSGISLPNDQNIRQQIGSKNIHLSSVVAAKRSLGFDAMVREFNYDPADLGDAESCAAPMWDAHLALHEVTGHGSGKVLVPDWQASLREYGSTIEEARADLVALHSSWDPKAVEIGLVPEERCAEIHATSYVQRFAIELRSVAGEEIEGDHLRGQSLIVQYARERGAVQVIQSSGKYFLVVDAVGRWRLALETLLGELMRIKAEGDYDAAKQLVQKYGTRVVREWREDALRRVEKLELPSRFAFVTPRLAPVHNDSGQVIDAELVQTLSLEDTMLSDAGHRPLR